LVFLLILALFHTISSEYTLTWYRISPQNLQARFEDTATSRGLIFDSYEYSLYLTNLDGDVILSYSHINSNSYDREDFMLSVMGTFYAANVTELSNSDLQAYLQSEAQYLLNVYQMMEKLGINAPDMPGAMGIYKMAMGFEKRRSKFGPDAVCKCNCPAAIRDYPACSDTARGKSPAQCSDCLGMCGSCGTCWTSVCGDCCWYHGCCGHDICCYSGSSSACLFPINLKCDTIYTCKDYDTNCCNTPPRGDGNMCRTQTWGCDPPTDGSCCNNGWKCATP